jgi:hypothetical protein
MKLKIAVLCTLSFAAFNASACFTLYDRNSRIIYQGLQTPIDMRPQFHEVLDRTHPGAHLVFDDSNICGSIPLERASTVVDSSQVVTTGTRNSRTKPDRN